MIKEEVKSIRLANGLLLPKLKGRTKIELTDVKTGKKEVVEHNNAFTTGLQSYFRALGTVCNSPFWEQSGNAMSQELWKSVLGGIFLFDSVLSADAKYMPAGVTMVANGYYNCVNGGNPSELGTYNQLESFANDNEIVMVYDWGTSQGNGTISAISLATAKGGYIGYGNATSKSSLSTKKSILDGEHKNDLYYDAQGAYYGAQAYHNNKIYYTPTHQINSGATSVTVIGQFFPISEIEVFRTIQRDITSAAAETITFNLPEALTEKYSAVSAGSAFPTKILLVPTSLNSNATKKIYFLDVTTGNVTSISLTNNTGANAYASTGIYLFLLDDTYALLFTGDYNNGTIYKINYQNSGVIGAVTKNGVSIINMDRTWIQDQPITDDLYVIGNSNYIYDKVKNEYNITNGYFGNYKGQTPFNWGYIAEEDILLERGCYNNRYNIASAIKNPLRLMTINNLDTPVEKTAAKTMKVTYTITRATE